MPAKIPKGEWLEDKFGRLIGMTNIIAKESQAEYSEPEYGFWSLKKEIALMYWIWPFLQIASQHFKSYYYIDLFAGSGLMKANSSDFFVGSPIVAIGSSLSDKKFSQYICLERDKTRRDALEKRANFAAKHFGTCAPTVLTSDCNQDLSKILNQYCPRERTCYLAFVDPEGISDLKWTTLWTLLAHGRGDIILNFPTSGIVRNFAIEKSENALNEFFGDKQWRNVSPSAEDLLEYYKRKIACVGYSRVVDNLPVYDELNHRLYDLVFATGSTGMNNALADLKNRLAGIKTKDIREIHKVIAGPQRQLLGF
jgi:three-Cys-motif partner protein